MEYFTIILIMIMVAIVAYNLTKSSMWITTVAMILCLYTWVLIAMDISTGKPRNRLPEENFIIFSCVENLAIIAKQSSPEEKRLHYYTCDMKEKEMLKGYPGVLRTHIQGNNMETDDGMKVPIGDYLPYQETEEK